MRCERDGTIFTTSYDKQFSLTRSATVKTGDVFVLRLAFCDERVVSLAHRMSCHARQVDWMKLRARLAVSRNLIRVVLSLVLPPAVYTWL